MNYGQMVDRWWTYDGQTSQQPNGWTDTKTDGYIYMYNDCTMNRQTNDGQTEKQTD